MERNSGRGFFFALRQSDTVFQVKLFSGSKGTDQPKISDPVEIRKNYERVFMHVVKKTGYSVEYVRRIPLTEFETLINAIKDEA